MQFLNNPQESLKHHNMDPMEKCFGVKYDTSTTTDTEETSPDLPKLNSSKTHFMAYLEQWLFA